jgi:DNA ligase-associated metallophosphoesterase
MTPLKGSTSITFAKQTFHLLPDRAIYWPARSTLVISDAHLGKAASFRTNGVPVPSGATTKDLSRLTSLLNQTAAQRLVILGDFLHSRAARQSEVLTAIAAWRTSHAHLPILLIRGNHDRSAGRVPAEWDIQEVEEPFTEDGICFSHDPQCPTQHPTLAGHIHPVVSLQDYDGTSITLPCFVLDETCLILPSFGTFTGGHRIPRQPTRQIFALAPRRILPIR